MRIPWTAAAAVLLAGALAAGGVEWQVRVKAAELKSAPDGFARPTAELPIGEEFEGTQEGEWVKMTEEGRTGWVHRSAVAAEDEVLKEPPMSLRFTGTFYPEDVQENDPALEAWLLNPVVRDTGPAPRAWELEMFRKAAGLGGGK